MEKLVKSITYYWYTKYQSFIQDSIECEDISSGFDALKCFLAYKLGRKNIPIVKEKWIYKLAKKEFSSSNDLGINKILKYFDDNLVRQSELVDSIKNLEFM